jgi:hypothetical protein
MTNSLVLAAIPPESRAREPLALTPAQALLRKMVLDAVPSPTLAATTLKPSTTSSNSVPAGLSPGPH